MPIKRDQIGAPATRGRTTATVNAGPLQGEVIVLGMMLSHHLALIGGARQDDKTVEYATVAQVLAGCILADDEAPVYSAAQWESFGAEHLAAALDLFAAVQSLSQVDPEASKKS